MNRPLLLLVCDFLLLSMFALARFDVPADAVVMEASQIVETDLTEEVSDEGLVKVLEDSLELERSENDEKSKSLVEVEEKLEKTTQLLAALQENYDLTQDKIQQLNAEKASGINEINRLEGDLARSKNQIVSIEQSSLKEKQKLQSDISKKDRDLLIQKTRLGEAQQAIKEKESLLNTAIREQAMLEQRLSDSELKVSEIEKKNTELEFETNKANQRNQLLDSTINILRSEKKLLSSNLNETRQTLAQERERNEELQVQTSRLTTSVADLAVKSEEMKKQITNEIRNTSIISPHEIFSDYLKRQVVLRFEYTGYGIVGNKVQRKKLVPSVLFRNPNNQKLYTAFHILDSPFEVKFRIQVPLNLSLYLDTEDQSIALTNMHMMSGNPDVILCEVKVPGALSGTLPEAYEITENPFQYKEAIIIQGAERKYGVSQYSVDPDALDILKVKNGNVFSNIIGTFKSKRGNFVFSQGGQFIGLMKSGNEALLIQELETDMAFGLGSLYDGPEIKKVLQGLFKPVRPNTTGFPRL